jgi:large subunit ribosomal protein L31
MKKDIHPKYFKPVKVKCACGNEFTVGSTLPEITVEICNACHPFWTGERRIADTVGRVDRLRKRIIAKDKIQKDLDDAKKKKAKKK